jgi:hypothetical protein
VCVGGAQMCCTQEYLLPFEALKPHHTETVHSFTVRPTETAKQFGSLEIPVVIIHKFLFPLRLSSSARIQRFYSVISLWR